MTASDISGDGAEPDPQSHGEKDEVDYIEYYDDGEWHAVLMDGTKCVAAGYGDSPEAAQKSLFGTTFVD